MLDCHPWGRVVKSMEYGPKIQYALLSDLAAAIIYVL